MYSMRGSQPSLWCQSHPYTHCLLVFTQIRCPKIDESKLDRQYLREFFDQADEHCFDWDVRSDSSLWSGVSVDGRDRVVGLDLTNGNLAGKLPETLCKVSQLLHLRATSNRLRGASASATPRA